MPLVPDSETTGNKDGGPTESFVCRSRGWCRAALTEAAEGMRRRRREDSDQEMTGGDVKLGCGICLTFP